MAVTNSVAFTVSDEQVREITQVVASTRYSGMFAPSGRLESGEDLVALFKAIQATLVPIADESAQRAEKLARYERMHNTLGEFVALITKDA